MKQGQPTFFNMDVYLSVVGMMINADEPIRALWMLDNVPAFFRDNPPPQLLDMREKLHRQLWTSVQYSGIYRGVTITPEHTAQHWPLRAKLLEEEIRDLNSKGIIPNVCELAGGSGWLPAGMKHKELQFSYEHMSLDGVSLEQQECSYNIFVAFELIEHLSDPWDIYRNALKFKRSFNLVVLSTPLYTFEGGMDDWENRELGHLCTFTPGEFHKIANEMFKGYAWTCALDSTIVLMGKK